MLLEIDNVTMRFGGLMALQNITFNVQQGETLGIMGANGAGKTTLFSLVAGHAQPTSGSIKLDGSPIARLRPDQVCARGIVRTYQIVRPFRGMSVIDNVTAAALYGARCEKRVARAQAIAHSVLEDVGLTARAGDLAGTLTLAGFKRLEIAKALAAGPRILLLDEVMAGLTPAEVNQAIAIIEACKEKYNLTVIVIEHVMKALMRMCPRILVLHHGETIAEGPPEIIATDEAVVKAYLGHN